MKSREGHLSILLRLDLQIW